MCSALVGSGTAVGVERPPSRCRGLYVVAFTYYASFTKLGKERVEETGTRRIGFAVPPVLLSIEYLVP